MPTYAYEHTSSGFGLTQFFRFRKEMRRLEVDYVSVIPWRSHGNPFSQVTYVLIMALISKLSVMVFPCLSFHFWHPYQLRAWINGRYDASFFTSFARRLTIQCSFWQTHLQCTVISHLYHLCFHQSSWHHISSFIRENILYTGGWRAYFVCLVGIRECLFLSS